MYKRPSKNESEEELLKQQEEFFKLTSQKKITPAAKVTTPKINENVQKLDDTTAEDNLQTLLANTFEAIPDNINLGKIIENVPGNKNITSARYMPNTGFPKAKRRDYSATGGKGSIFAQQMKKLRKNNENGGTEMEVDEQKDINVPSSSTIVTGSEKDQIHLENVQKLKTMSEKDILEEKERLIATMDPAIVAFLRSKREKNKFAAVTTNAIAEKNEAGKDVDVEEIEASKEILHQPKSEKWIHFNNVETSKLAWMKDIKISKTENKKEYEARFDFEGWLLPYSNPDINEKNRILYHHGEEPERPGYTLQELFQLARSSVVQQKIIALNTIANILSLQSTGVYDGIVEIPTEQVFFVLRVCLDENTPAVLNAAVKALRNLLWNKVDETCADATFGFGVGLVQPVLAVDESDDDKTVNDQQMVERNLVKCLVRTNILTRIRYIINSVKPATETIVYCLDILCRLSRDSYITVRSIFVTENLISNIIDYFIPKIPSLHKNPDDAYGVPLVQAVKLLRLIAVRGRDIATELINKYKIMDSVAYYLSNETFSNNTAGLQLQTECLRLWACFAHCSLAFDYFNLLQPILLRIVHYHVEKIDLNGGTSYTMQAHASAVIVLLNTVAANNAGSVVPFVDILSNLAVMKWSKQFMGLTEYLTGKLQCISSLFLLLSTLTRLQVIRNKETIQSTLISLVKSSGFAVVTSDIQRRSNILNDYKSSASSANLLILEAVAWGAAEHVVPILHSKSCLPFLYDLSEFVLNSDSIELKKCFLNQENVTKYVTALRSTKKYSLITNWFTRSESFFIVNILKLSVQLRDSIDTYVYFELAVKCLNILNSEQRKDAVFILQNIIFSKQFYPSHLLVENLTIKDVDGSLENLESICNVYLGILGLKNEHTDFSENLSVSVKTGNIIPADWIYTPILIMYTDQQENRMRFTEDQRLQLVMNCLQWIYIYETFFADLAAFVNPSERFCRLACVFLADDSLFLNPEVHNLLEACLKLLVEKNVLEINFNQPIRGLTNFRDLYVQLLEQYQGVSYGDILFGNVILLPLAQKNDVKLRKTLWSEYAGVLQILNVTPEQCLCPVEIFLEPVEQDLSLVNCYKNALRSGVLRRNSVLYKIAEYHVIKSKK